MKTFGTVLFAGILVLALSTVVFAAGNLDSAVVLYYNFDEGNGDTATDLSGNGNDGVITGANWVNGKYKGALEFDGAGAHVEVAASPTLDLTDGVTLMAWIYKSEILPANNGETIISKKQSGAYCLEVGGWNNAVPEKLDSEMRISGTYHRLADPESLPLDKWVHAAVTYDGDKMRLYRDGELVAEQSFPGSVDTNAANLYIGAESDGNKIDASHGKFSGMIDEVVIANRPFDEDEIKSFMAGLTPVLPQAKLSSCWAMIKVGY